jgi:hypothetical protein
MPKDIDRSAPGARGGPRVRQPIAASCLAELGHASYEEETVHVHCEDEAVVPSTVMGGMAPLAACPRRKVRGCGSTRKRPRGSRRRYDFVVAHRSRFVPRA